MKPTRWSGQNDSEFGPSLDLSFGDFHHITIDNDGIDFVMSSRGGFVVWHRELNWQELFAVVFEMKSVTGEKEDDES